MANENRVINEVKTLDSFFNMGLSYFHLRKPSFTEQDYINYLNQIDKKHYSKIIIHDYHHLAQKYNLKGIHLKEKFKLDLKENLDTYVIEYKSKGFSVSSSFHNLETIRTNDSYFDYHFLSPIFDSISKQGYKGKGFSVHSIPKKIIGMGGVNANNLNEIKEKGYQGAAVLGAVWYQVDKINAFKAIMNKANSIIWNA